jgi:hypothetical protein
LDPSVRWIHQAGAEELPGSYRQNIHNYGARRVRTLGPSDNNNGYKDEIFTKRVRAGKRTYFFDVKSTKSEKDFYITITESKRVGDDDYEKHKLFLYKGPCRNRRLRPDQPAPPGGGREADLAVCPIDARKSPHAVRHGTGLFR